MHYIVYRRGDDYKLVKKGFSWPALFLNWLWFYSKGMVMIGSLFLVLPIVFDIIYINFTVPFILTDLDILLLIGCLAVIFLPAFFGNQWWENTLCSNGWVSVYSIQANNYLDAKRQLEIWRSRTGGKENEIYS